MYQRLGRCNFRPRQWWLEGGLPERGALTATRPQTRAFLLQACMSSSLGTSSNERANRWHLKSEELEARASERRQRDELDVRELPLKLRVSSAGTY